MGAITIGGKGSRSRVRDRKGYAINRDSIKWKSEQRNCLNCGRRVCVDAKHTGTRPCKSWQSLTHTY